MLYERVCACESAAGAHNYNYNNYKLHNGQSVDVGAKLMLNYIIPKESPVNSTTGIIKTYIDILVVLMRGEFDL